jgi:hypothetical protein
MVERIGQNVTTGCGRQVLRVINDFFCQNQELAANNTTKAVMKMRLNKVQDLDEFIVQWRTNMHTLKACKAPLSEPLQREMLVQAIVHVPELRPAIAAWQLDDGEVDKLLYLLEKHATRLRSDQVDKPGRPQAGGVQDGKGKGGKGKKGKGAKGKGWQNPKGQAKGNGGKGKGNTCKGSKGGQKDWVNGCHNCGSPDHWARDCPAPSMKADQKPPSATPAVTEEKVGSVLVKMLMSKVGGQIGTAEDVTLTAAPSGHVGEPIEDGLCKVCKGGDDRKDCNVCNGTGLYSVATSYKKRYQRWLEEDRTKGNIKFGAYVLG